MDALRYIDKIGGLVVEATLELAHSNLTEEEKSTQFVVFRAHLASMVGTLLGGCRPEIVEEHAHILRAAAQESTAARMATDVIKKAMTGGAQS